MASYSKKKQAVVAMSGGIDSSVAAALLKKQGYSLVGVFMKFWKEGKSGTNKCCSFSSERSARLVCKKLEIPFYVLDARKEFKKRVVDYFLKEHKKGSTPNPCVVCNKEIKFGLLMEKALKTGADYVATGHYSRIKFQNSKFKLLKGKDRGKDQSYFLWQLEQKQLKHILFPLGGYTKNQAKQLIKKFELPVETTSESQEICFVKDSVSNFLKKYLRLESGKIIDKFGKFLGKHQGLWLYTIGQRKGIQVFQGPYYAVEKDFKNNILIVSKNKKDLLKKELIARNVNWILGKEPKTPLRIKAKIRYCSQFSEGIVSKIKNKRYKVVFIKP